jgi:SPOR domain
MAENKLEGFEDFDNVLGEAQAEAAGGEPGKDFAGELDDLLGSEASTAQAAAEGAAPAAGGGGESELDSFFEDLSTIDDLEVLQEEQPAPAAAAAEEAPPEAEPEEAPPPPPRRAAAEPERERPRPAPRPRGKRKRGFFGRWFRRLIFLAILAGVGYFVYQFFFPDLQPPWQVVQQEKSRLMNILQQQLNQKLGQAFPSKPVQRPPALPPVAPPPPPPPPPPVMHVRPKARPAARPPAPPREHGPWSIQVATCFFPSCLDSYRAYLEVQHRSVLVRDKASQSESLEIYSISTWQQREQAQELSDRINLGQPMEGHAFLLHEDGGYRISMGAFADLARANFVKDALNQKYQGQVVFATRVRAFPYKVQSVLTGRYPTREAADQALAALKNAEPRLRDAFVTRNQ